MPPEFARAVIGPCRGKDGGSAGDDTAYVHSSSNAMRFHGASGLRAAKLFPANNVQADASLRDMSRRALKLRSKGCPLPRRSDHACRLNRVCSPESALFSETELSRHQPSP